MNKKTIIIIGASSGIGKALFEKYAADGNHVGIVGRRTNLLEELREQYPANTLTATADITKTDEAEKANVTDVRPGLVDTAMAKGEGLFWVMPVEKVARHICTAIRHRKSKAYVTKRWHILASINKNLPFSLYKRL